MPLDDAFADGQADARPLGVRGALQPLEDLEDPLPVLGLNSHPIVLYLDLGQAGIQLAPTNSGHRGHARATVLEDVTQEVLEELDHLAGIRVHRRQRGHVDGGVALLQRGRQIPRFTGPNASVWVSSRE